MAPQKPSQEKDADKEGSASDLATATQKVSKQKGSKDDSNLSKVGQDLQRMQEQFDKEEDPAAKQILSARIQALTNIVPSGNTKVTEPVAIPVGDPETGSLDKQASKPENARQTDSPDQDMEDAENEGEYNDGPVGKADGQTIKKEDEDEGDEPLFVPESEKGQSDDNVGGELDEDGEEPLYVRHMPTLSGQVETVGWGNARRGTFYINRYGKKGASRYRMEMLADSAEYEERTKNDADPQKVSNSNNRYGEKTLASGNWKYTKRHIIGIWGVAWEGADAGDRTDDLDLIDPDKVTGRWPATFVLVMWKIDGERKKAWETRTSLRNRWTKKLADAAIYKAAFEAEARYAEATTGVRPASSRSPSRGLAHAETQRFRLLSEDEAAPQGRAVRFQSDDMVDELAQALKNFKLSFEELWEKRIQDMDAHEQAKMVTAWQVQKTEILSR